MSVDLSMDGETALVTGGSRGVGRGVAEELHRRGARVYATGRTVAEADLPDGVVRLPCDHTDDAEAEAIFERIAEETGAIDILVNSAWGGYEGMVEDGEFTWSAPFWKQPRWRWSAMMDAGVRALFVASQLAAPGMIERGRGLIVHLSYWAARKHLGNAIYGASKAATDKLTADMSLELSEHGVSVVSLYPGLVRTELVQASGIELENAESPRFQGRAVAALWNDPALADRSGSVVVTSELARELGFTDIDGSLPEPLTLETA